MPIPNETKVVDWISSLSNWGRWGPDDEMGTLNLVTPEKRREAAGLVRDGITVSCSRALTTAMTPDVNFQMQRFMVDSGEARDTDPEERKRTRRGAAEYLGLVFHGHTVTHVDALSHYSWQGRMYNDKEARLITSREGAQVLSIEPASAGIVSRGVLLDVPAVRGVEWLEPDAPVMPADLDAAEAVQGVRVREGDVVLVRTGNVPFQAANAPRHFTEPMVACQAACAPWLKERGVAMFGTDTPNDVRPSQYPSVVSPFHILSLVSMGLWLIDNADLEALAATCAKLERYEFMLTVAPLVLRSFTGSPVNPIAVF